LINIKQWSKDWVVIGDHETSICLELATSIDLFLEYLKSEGLSKNTTNRYFRNLVIFAPSLVKEFIIERNYNKTLKDFYGESFMPNYFCTNIRKLEYDDKALTAYENMIDKFWEFYNTIEKK